MAPLHLGLAVSFATDGTAIERVYAQTLDDLALGEDLGFDGAYVQEHHFAPSQWCPSPLVALAAIAARTRRLRVGTAMLLLPFYHPVRLAEDSAVLDALSGGRLTLGVAQGYRAAEFSGLGVPVAARGARFEEAVELLRRCWMDERVMFRGTFFEANDVSVTPRPIQQPHPPLWIGAISAAGIRRAARLGLPYCLGNTISLATLVERRRLYEAALAGGAQHPAAGVRPLLRELYVAEDDDQAWREAGPLVARVHGTYRAWGFEDADEKAAANGRDGDTAALRAMLRDRVVIGDPEHCVREIERYRRALDPTHLILRVHVPGLAASKVRQALTLFARGVAPHIRESAAGPSAEVRALEVGDTAR